MVEDDNLDAGVDGSISPHTCPKCGRIVGRIGSFTYWIFQDDRCKCDPLGLPAATGGTPRDSVAQVINGRYELDECVGQGGIGLVYRARDLSNGNQVALKLIRPDHAKNELALQRLLKEAALVSSVQHANLGRVFSCEQEFGMPFLVMEFVDGRNLEKIIQQTDKMPVRRALDVFLQICDGLNFAHSKGIIHRDIKPGNVIVKQQSDGRELVKIVDFGFAKLLKNPADQLQLTHTGEVFGSPAYMSPEQCLGEELDFRSDIYALGCLMYETLTGKPPFCGENILSTIAKQIRDEAVSMRVHDSTISCDLDTIVLKCLKKDPNQRYQSVSGIRADLAKVKKGAPIRVKQPVLLLGHERQNQAQEQTNHSYPIPRKLLAIAAAIGIGCFTIYAATKKDYDTIRSQARVPIRQAESPINNHVPIELATFRTADGISLRYPGNWSSQKFNGDGGVLDVIVKTRYCWARASLYHYMTADLTPDQFLTIFSTAMKRKSSTYTEIGREKIHSNPYQVELLQFSTVYAPGEIAVGRMAVFKDQNSWYALQLNTIGASDDEMKSLFQTMYNSLRFTPMTVISAPSSNRSDGKYLFATLSTFRTPNNQITLQYPKNWIRSPSSSQALLDVIAQTKDSYARLELSHRVYGGITADQFADHYLNSQQAQFSDCKETVRKMITYNGHPAIESEIRIHPELGASIVKHVAFINVGNAWYTLVLTSSRANNAEMSQLFQRILSSNKLQTNRSRPSP